MRKLIINEELSVDGVMQGPACQTRTGAADSNTAGGWVDPIVLGTGKRLFREGIPKVELELVGSTTSSTGVSMLTYRPAKA